MAGDKSSVVAAAGKKETKLGIDAKKAEDLSAWYTQVTGRE
jgi:hypothetical protein